MFGIPQTKCNSQFFTNSLNSGIFFMPFFVSNSNNPKYTVFLLTKHRRHVNFIESKKWTKWKKPLKIIWYYILISWCREKFFCWEMVMLTLSGIFTATFLMTSTRSRSGYFVGYKIQYANLHRKKNKMNEPSSTHKKKRKKSVSEKVN